MLGTNSLVTVLQHQAASAVHHKSQDGEYTERPCQTEIGNHCIGGQGVGQAAKARAGRSHTVSKGALFGEPLRDYTDGGGEAKAESESET